MRQESINELLTAINVIGLLKARIVTFRKELDFAKELDLTKFDLIPASILGAIKRLEHEVMFLCIESYSLHQGISKKRSLFSKVIKQYGKDFSKVDKSDTVSPESFIHLGTFGEDGQREATEKEQEDMLKVLNSLALDGRKSTQEELGIKSHKHEDIDAWIEEVIDEDILAKLQKYRDGFAHRLDSLESIKCELNIHKLSAISEMIEVVSGVLGFYDKHLKALLYYTTSNSFEGRRIRYDSLSRIQQAQEFHGMKHPEKNE